MQNKFETLLSILEQEYYLFTELYARMVEERNAFSAMETHRIIEITNQKETLALQIKALEESRITIIASIGEELDTKAETLTISKIAEYADEPVRISLLAIANELKATALNIQKVNSQSRLIAEYTLGFIDALQNQLKGLVSGGKIYYVRNKTKSYSSPGQLLEKKA